MKTKHPTVFGRYLNAVSMRDHGNRRLGELRTEAEFERRLALVIEHEQAWRGAAVML